MENHGFILWLTRTFEYSSRETRVQIRYSSNSPDYSILPPWRLKHRGLSLLKKLRRRCQVPLRFTWISCEGLGVSWSENKNHMNYLEKTNTELSKNDTITQLRHSHVTLERVLYLGPFVSLSVCLHTMYSCRPQTPPGDSHCYIHVILFSL